MHRMKIRIRKDANTVNYVMEILRQKEALKQLPVIRMEIDYELVTLHDALQANEQETVIRTKERLNQLRIQWIEAEQNM